MGVEAVQTTSDHTETMSDRAETAVRATLAGRRRGALAFLPFAGPAFLCSVAYMDPGNFATNIQAGAKYGYSLLWVALAANIIAMLFQGLSARLGIVTNHNLAELCRTHFPRPAVLAMWGVSEIAAMATDLAEFLGGAIGLSLLFGMPLLAGMVVTGIATYAILAIQGRGFRPIELVITGLVSVIGVCYLIELFLLPPDWRLAVIGAVVPTLPDAGAVTLAVGMVGATVMPHAIYLHSSLTQNRAPARTDVERHALLRFSDIEVLVALGIAGLVNMAMVMMAATAFHAGHEDVAEIETAYRTLIPLFGVAAGGVFMMSLIASGLSSSAVGTMAGQVIMQGFVGFRIPLVVRRLVTMVPAFAVVAWGVNATEALIMSQVVLSLALPVPMVALLLLMRRCDVMGAYVMRRPVQAAAWLATTIVLGLNALLLLQTFSVPLPGLPPS
jgi:manganese transport protein